VVIDHKNRLRSRAETALHSGGTDTVLGFAAVAAWSPIACCHSSTPGVARLNPRSRTA
jgi:hypothetical protein